MLVEKLLLNVWKKQIKKTLIYSWSCQRSSNQGGTSQVGGTQRMEAEAPFPRGAVFFRATFLLVELV